MDVILEDIITKTLIELMSRDKEFMQVSEKYLNSNNESIGDQLWEIMQNDLDYNLIFCESISATAGNIHKPVGFKNMVKKAWNKVKNSSSVKYIRRAIHGGLAKYHLNKAKTATQKHISKARKHMQERINLKTYGKRKHILSRIFAKKK